MVIMVAIETCAYLVIALFYGLCSCSNSINYYYYRTVPGDVTSGFKTIVLIRGLFDFENVLPSIYIIILNTCSRSTTKEEKTDRFRDKRLFSIL